MLAKTRTIVIPLLAALLVLGVGAAFIDALEDRREGQLQMTMETIGSSQAYSLQRQLDRSLSVTYALATIIRQSGRIDDFPQLAADMIRIYGGLTALQLAPDGVVRQIYPVAGNEGAIGHDLMQDPKRRTEAEATIASGKLTLAGPFPLVQGGTGAVGRLPVFVPDGAGGERFWGFAQALIRIEDLVAATELDSLAGNGYAFELWRLDPDSGEKQTFRRVGTLTGATTATFAVAVPNGTWHLTVGLPATTVAAASHRRLGIGLAALVATLVGASAGLALRASSERGRRSRAEAAERHFRLLGDVIPQLVYTHAPDGAVDYVNARWREATGLAPEEAYRGGWERVVHPDDRAQLAARWARSVRTGEDFEAEYRMRTQGGSYRWYLGRARAARDDAGRIVKWFGTGTDIDAQKRATLGERLLAETSKQLTAARDPATALPQVAAMAVPSLADLCIIDLVDEDGLLRHAGVSQLPGLPRLLAAPRDPRHPAYEVLRSRQTSFLPQVDAETMAQALTAPEEREWWRGIQPRSMITAPIMARGRTFGLVNFTLTERSQRGHDEATLALCNELAHRIALALDSQRAYQQAQRASRMKEEFLATLSHELRTPLNVILGHTDLLRAGYGDAAERDESLAAIARNAQHQTQLVDDLLDMSSIASGKLDVDRRPVALGRVIEAATASLALAARAKGVSIETRLDASAPLVRGDPARLQQVVWNLLANAIKFTPRGGRVGVTLRREGDAAELAVWDDGKGISPEFLPHLFERFRQEDSAMTRRFGGLGLGLALVRHLVEMHGGTVRAESEGPGKGARFVVHLPALDTLADDADASTEHVAHRLDEPVEGQHA